MTDTALTREMRRRAEALHESRRVLAAQPSPISRGSVEPTDVHALAVFILDGGDPWALAPVMRESDERPEPGVLDVHYEDADGGGQGFTATDRFTVTVHRPENAYATCTVQHEGTVVFAGAEQPSPTAEALTREVDLGYEARLVEAQALVERENERGGEAREVVLLAAQRLGIDLTDDVRGAEMWSPENMRRVVEAVSDLVAAQATAPRILIDEPEGAERVIDGDGDEWRRPNGIGPWLYGDSVQRVWSDMRRDYGPLFANLDDYSKAVGL